MARFGDGDVQLEATVLGRGARFVVYAGTYKGRPIAAKTVANPAVADLHDVDRALEREHAALSLLDHPNIVESFGLWRSPENQQLHLITERAFGQPLDAMIKVCQTKRSYQGARHWDEPTQEIIRQIGAALVHAHRHKVLHNDLKPDNIVVGLNAQGEIEVKLLDFDSAGVDSRRGRCEYTAPERIAGEKATPRSDVYGFGILIYKLLSGTLPYRQPDPNASLTEKKTPVDQPVDETGRGAWAWIRRSARVAAALTAACDFDPRKRPRSVADLLGLLLPDASVSRFLPWPLVSAGAGLVVAALLILPLGDGPVQRLLLERPPRSACLSTIGGLAVEACTLAAPGEPGCPEALVFTPAPEECVARTSVLKACIGKP